MLKKQKNLISSKRCPPPSSKPPLRLPRADGNSEKISVFSLAQTRTVRKLAFSPSHRPVTSNLPLCSPSCPPCISKKSGVSRYPSDPPHRKDQFFSCFTEEGRGYLFKQISSILSYLPKHWHILRLKKVYL